MQDQDESPATPPQAAERSDQELLLEYATTGAEGPFAQLVERHLGLVYSAALRQTGSHASAQDVTQAVFLILARKAPSLRRETVLAGWLFRATRYAALDWHKIEARRQLREQEAARMQAIEATLESGADWEAMAPLLDEAVASLTWKDRQVVLLRYFEKQSFGEIGAALGANDNAARVRVVRAVEKLRGFFRKRGVALSAAALSTALLDHSVQAAPSGLGSMLLAPDAARRPMVESLVRRGLRRSAWKRWIPAAAAILFLFIGAGRLTRRPLPNPPPAAMVSPARSVREAVLAIDRAFVGKDPEGFAALIRFRNDEERRFRPVFTNYIRAESDFRQAMQEAFHVQQRTFDATFRELCLGQPPVPTNFIQAAKAATNVMTGRYPLHLIKVGDAWYWDWFDGLSRATRDQRLAALESKAHLLDEFTRQVRGGAPANLTNILETFRGATP